MTKSKKKEFRRKKRDEKFEAAIGRVLKGVKILSYDSSNSEISPLVYPNKKREAGDFLRHMHYLVNFHIESMKVT